MLEVADPSHLYVNIWIIYDHFDLIAFSELFAREYRFKLAGFCKPSLNVFMFKTKDGLSFFQVDKTDFADSLIFF